LIKKFYKIQDGKLIRGSGFKIPAGMIEHTEGKEPKVLLDIMKSELEVKQLLSVSNELQSLCDSKSKDAKNYIANKKVSDEQLKRYNDKLEMAIKYKENGLYKDEFELEADFQGWSVDELVDFIIEKGNQSKQDLIVYNSKIEAFRVATQKLIKNGELDKANEVIKKAKLLKADATDDDIKELFK